MPPSGGCRDRKAVFTISFFFFVVPFVFDDDDAMRFGGWMSFPPSSHSKRGRRVDNTPDLPHSPKMVVPSKK